MEFTDEEIVNSRFDEMIHNEDELSPLKNKDDIFASMIPKYDYSKYFDLSDPNKIRTYMKK